MGTGILNNNFLKLYERYIERNTNVKFYDMRELDSTTKRYEQEASVNFSILLMLSIYSELIAHYSQQWSLYRLLERY